MNRLYRRPVMLTVLAMLTLVSAGAVLRAQSKPDLELKAAMDKEVVDGDLKGAIEQYKKVAESSDRALAAKALVRMAECYLKLGDAQAKSIYERIVSTYSDQKEAYTVARSRLNAAERKPAQTTGAGLTIQTIQQVANARGDRGTAQVSPDGRYVSTDESQNLALREINTGKVLPLQVVKPDGIETYPLTSTFSPDGKQLAVQWYFDSDNRSRLWVVSTVGGGPRNPKVLYDNPEVTNIAPYDWSRDGKWIAVQVNRKDLTAQVGVVKLDDGSLRVLRSTEWIGSSHMAFSPDSRYLAYDRPGGEGEIDRDVFVIAVDGSREIPAVVNPGDDRVVGWAPDGSRLLFSSDRSGTVGLWAIPLRDGTSQGIAEFVTDFGNGRSMGLTDSGILYYRVLRGGADIWTAPFDATTGQLSSPPVRPIRQFSGLNQMPEWSADGKYLAYASKRDASVPSGITLVISSADTGQVVREVRPKLSYLLYPRWSPDGRTFIARGGDLKGRSGIVKFDATTGDASLVVPNEVCSGLPFWSSSSDGTFFCFDFDGKRILQVDVTSGAVRRAWPSVGQGADASRDGRYLVYGSQTGLALLPLSGGESRELLRLEGDTKVGNWTSITFTPDGRHVAFAGTVHGEYSMWLVSIDGGQPRKINVDAKSISMWRFNPKTWQIAYAPSNAPSYEVRKMENFLPAPTSARK